MKNLKKYIKEEVSTALEAIKIAHPDNSKQLNLNLKLHPVDVLTKRIEEMEDEMQSNLADIEMLLRDNNLASNQAIKLLELIEVEGKSYITKIKAMKRLVQLATAHK
jgi:hypothetical protein